MKILILFMLSLLTLAGSSLRAQTTHHDSVTLQAQTDAQNFSLSNAGIRRLHGHRLNATSDYFKPTKASVSDTTLLHDSTYVKAYRSAACKKTRRSAGHGLLEAAIIVVVSAAALVALFTYVIHPG